MPMPMLSNRIEAAEHAASAYLWCGRPATPSTAWWRCSGTRRRRTPRRRLGAVLALAARAAADVADAAGASDATRRELRDQLHRLLEQAQVDPFARSGCFDARPAQGAAWAAETARLVGRPSLELWADGRRHWDRLGRPHDAAYCRWRGAQVALATGQGTVAARLLRRAARDAREHVPAVDCHRRDRGRRGGTGLSLDGAGQAASARSCRATATAAARPARLAPIVLADGP